MNFRRKHALWCVSLGLLVLVPSGLCGQDAPPRVGFEETFNTIEGWFIDAGAPIKSVTADRGTVTFETVRGALGSHMKPKPHWPEWPKAPFTAFTMMGKRYDVTVDLSVYHYLVVKLDERGTAVKLFVCGRETPVCYTTGLRAFDLRHIDLDGKQKVRLSIEFLNSSGVGTFDFIRLVRKLTPAEEKVLMPPPATYVEEKLRVHPYHRLEALNARAGRERKPEAEGQLVCYEDTASRGRVWKLTDQPGDQAFRSGDRTAGWSSDGRYFSVTGGRDGKNVWDPAAGAWRETMGGGKLSTKPMPKYAAMWESRDHANVVYGYRTHWHRPDVDFMFYRYDRVKGEETEFARFTTLGKWDVRELSPAEKGDKVVLGLRGTFRVWIIDPNAKAPAKVVTPIRLPARLKGLHFADDDTKLIWFNCYTYEQLQMDLATRKVTLGYYTSGGHAGGGGGKTLRHYAGMTTVQPRGLTDWRAGDKVKIFAYYKKPIDTDYGRLIDGARWWLTNGTGGDVANQHILVDGKDCATVLRLCGYNTSRNTWATNTYSIASPDATKVAWVSDQLGDGDVHYVVARKPDSPRNLRLTKLAGERVRLTWDVPERSEETAEYIIYGAKGQSPFRPVEDPKHRGVRTIQWTGKTDATRFMLTAKEWSGLESLPSNVVTVTGAAPATVHLDVWQGTRSTTARVVFDGRASATRCVRAFRASPAEEVNPFVTWDDARLPAGKRIVWIRRRDDRPGTTWEWKRLAGNFDEPAVRIPENTLVDKIIVTTDPDYVPKTIDDRFPPPVIGARRAKAEVAADGTVRLTWPAMTGLYQYSHVEIFADTDPDFKCTNETVIGAVTKAQKQQFVDWGLKPGSTVTYKLVSVSGQGLRSEPVAVTAQIPAVPKLVYEQVGAERAEAGAKLEMIDRGDRDMLAAKPIKPLKTADPATFVPMNIPFEVPVDGRYTIWVRYAPGYTRRLGIVASIDDGDAGTWRVRPPYRPMSSRRSRGRGRGRVFTDRFGIDARNVFALDAGKHVLRLRLDPAIPDGEVHAIERIYVTNDPSFRPNGFDPRADFGKRSR